jgi:hypothetical protein
MLKKIFIVIGLLGLVGCANVQEKPQTQVIDRLSEEQLASMMPQPVSQLNYESLLALAKSGSTPAQMIEKLKETDTSFDLTPQQVLSLHQAGIDISVLEYLHTSRQKAMQNNIANTVAEHDKTKNDEIFLLKKRLQQERLNNSYVDPFCRFGYPYPYGWGPRVRSGVGIGISR